MTDVDVFFPLIPQLSQVLDSWQQTRVAVARIAEVMALQTLTSPAEEPQRPGRSLGALTLTAVRFSYPGGAGRPDGAAHRIVVLEHGQVVESGSHDEVIAARGTYASMWEAFETHAHPARSA